MADAHSASGAEPCKELSLSHWLPAWLVPSWNHSHVAWKRPPRSSGPAINPGLSPNHVPMSHIYTSFKCLQGWCPHCCPGQPVPVFDNLFSEDDFPNSQPKLPLNSRLFPLVLSLLTFLQLVVL